MNHDIGLLSCKIFNFSQKPLIAKDFPRIIHRFIHAISVLKEYIARLHLNRCNFYRVPEKILVIHPDRKPAAVKNLILAMNGEKPLAQVNPGVPVRKVL